MYCQNADGLALYGRIDRIGAEAQSGIEAAAKARTFRMRAAHCRELAIICYDQKILEELEKFARELEEAAEAEEARIQVQRRECNSLTMYDDGPRWSGGT